MKGFGLFHGWIRWRGVAASFGITLGLGILPGVLPAANAPDRPAATGASPLSSPASPAVSAPAGASAPGAPVRLAVGPFFAPVTREDLRPAAQLLPELLTVDLSRDARFTVLERRAVDGVWGELGLSGQGLVQRETVARLGRVLACDWILSGSIVETDGRTYLWTRIIDAPAGEVVDLQSAPFNPGVTTNVAAQMAAFVASAGRGQTRRQHVALGPMVEMSPDSAGRESWAGRISALLERELLQRGIGVAEIAAIRPVFEERQFEDAGLLATPGSRVKLRPAFWLVDGGCDWVDTAGEGRVAVGLRVQRPGDTAQFLWVTNAPTAALEQQVVANLLEVLNRPARPAASTAAGTGANAEVELLVARGREMAERRSPFRPRISPGPAGGWMTQWDQYKQMTEQHRRNLKNREALQANYERLVLSDPKNMEAKVMLAHCWIGEADVATQERALALMREVAANTVSPRWAESARRFLDNPKMIEQVRGQTTRAIPRPRDWNSVHMAYRENPKDPEAQCDLGEALLGAPRAHDRKNGRDLLTAAASGPDAKQAARARQLLALPERKPAYEIPPDPPAPKIELPKETAAEAARREFLQANFDRFVPLKFERVPLGNGLNATAVIQHVPVQKNLLRHAGRLYAGFRFVIPQNVGGDFEWMHLLAKGDADRDFTTRDFQWYIIPRSGQMAGFTGYRHLDLERFPKLQARFPHTRSVFEQELDSSRFTPGQEYAIWFGFSDERMPDIAVSITLGSTMGRQVYGQRPLQ